MSVSLQKINARVRREAAFVQDLLAETGRIIVGQEQMLHRMLVALLCDGHILIEGLPGLAKTLAVRTLAATINARFQRIQFTPDLLPSDLIGTQVFNPVDGTFSPRKGPIFSNIILADEINRAPAKVQSALLESMEERQITLGEETFLLDDPYMVLATQNPIEQEGTYLLPEAQLDRFMLKVVIEYPRRDEERAIIDRMSGTRPDAPRPVIDTQTIRRARRVVEKIYVDDEIKDYVLDLIFATRSPGQSGNPELAELQTLIEFGVSPRATIFLIKAAKANAFLEGRGYVVPDDVKSLTHDIMRHRLILSFQAQAENVTTDQIITRILECVKVP